MLSVKTGVLLRFCAVLDPNASARQQIVNKQPFIWAENSGGSKNVPKLNQSSPKFLAKRLLCGKSVNPGSQGKRGDLRKREKILIR